MDPLVFNKHTTEKASANHFLMLHPCLLGVGPKGIIFLRTTPLVSSQFFLFFEIYCKDEMQDATALNLSQTVELRIALVYESENFNAKISTTTNIQQKL